MSTLTVGTDKQYSSIQAAIDAASEGDTILVYPGTYTETSYLLVDKSLTIKGVDASGHDLDRDLGLEASVSAGAASPTGAGFVVQADNVTITGLNFYAFSAETGFDVTGNGFTLQSSTVSPPGSSHWSHGAVYIRDIGTDPTGFVSHITTYKIDGNHLTGAVIVANGTGYGHVPGDLDMEVTNNSFAGISAFDNASNPVAILGQGDADGDDGLYIPVVMPTEISGNVIHGAVTYLAETEKDAAEIDIDLAYVEAFIANNDLGQYAYGIDGDGELLVDPGSGASLVGLPGDIETTPGDTIVVSMYGNNVSDTIDGDGVIVEVLSGGHLSLTLGSEVTGITLTGSGASSVSGNVENNIIVGNSALNDLFGGNGDDVLAGGGGDDYLYGESGVDTAAYSATLTSAALSIPSGWRVHAGAEGNDWLYGIEIVSHAGGRFLLVGHGGFSTFGEAIAVATKPGDVVVTNTSDDPANQAFDLADETVDFDITTGSGDDTIATGSGDDVISSGAGADMLHGGAGDDLLTGGAGNDAIDGGAGTDTAVYGSSLTPAALSVVGGAWQADGGSEGVDTLAGVEIVSHAGGRFLLVGNGGFASAAEALAVAALPGDVVVDSSATDDGDQSIDLGDATVPLLVTTGSGDDAITTGSGDDTISSGAGKDKVKAGKGNDTVQAGDGNDKVIGNAGDDALHGDAGKDKIKGGNGKDALYGGDGNDKLVGGKGDDTLYGNAGKDKLVGGKGSDTFVFNDLGKKDKVQDFHPGEDKLAFDGDVFTGLGEAGPLEAEYFGFGKHAKTADQKLIYQKSKGVLWYDADGNGGGEAVKVAVLKHAPHLTADDILVI